jgi:uncharacterized protein (DUF4415 family)
MSPEKNSNHRRLEIPEIPANAKLKPLHRRPSRGARLPREEVQLRLDKHILTWCRYEAERQRQPIDVFINEALRQLIVRQIGDREIRAGGLNPLQRAEVQVLIGEMLTNTGKRRQVAA